LSTEKRRSPRVDLNAPAAITWHKPDGSRYYEKALLLNLSKTGALLEVPSKLAMRQFIKIEAPEHGIDGMASVRFCDQKGLKYLAGIEFINAVNPETKKSKWT
jgi:hypothetical protein